MSIYLIHLDRRVHTCPAEPDPHPYDIRRTILAVTDGGPCRTPVTIRCGDTEAVVPCGRQLPAAQHCAACRTVVVEHTITDHHTGPHPTGHQPVVPAGYADQPCDVCGQPLAAVLAATGRHILCQPHTRTTRKTSQTNTTSKVAA
jgi:hypothetical protein